MPETALNRSLFQLLPKQKQIEFIDNLTEQEATELEYYWPFWARDGQIAPVGDWHIWLVNAGRDPIILSGQPVACGSEYGVVEIVYISGCSSNHYSLQALVENNDTKIFIKPKTVLGSSSGASAVFKDGTRMIAYAKFKKA